MGVRVQRRLRVGRWLWLNVSGRGLSVTLGRRGLKLNLSAAGIVLTVGWIGSGVSYRYALSPRAMHRASSRAVNAILGERRRS